MKRKLVNFLLFASLSAFAQRGGHAGGGAMGGPPAGVGGGAGSNIGHSVGSAPDTHQGQPSDKSSKPNQEQRPLKDSQINSGAFKMLEKKTGMTADQLQAMYTSSGAKNFGQFVSAVVVSKNLGLDTTKVLDGLKTGSLGQTLQNLGVPEDKAKEAMKKANDEAKNAEKHS
jgi:hypothetical protein